MPNSKVVMMGLGYIGLPTAALVARAGLDVRGVDVSTHVVETINRGRIHIVEPDLDLLVKKVVEGGKLKAHGQPAPADYFLIMVPTPFKGDREPDIAFVESATRMVIPFLAPGNVFIIESTSPVGTTQKMADLIYIERPELLGKLHIAYCPERVLPGNVIYELENNDRVIGGLTPEAAEKAAAFYRNFVRGKLHLTTASTAELCKLVENSYRDVNIAFANELSMICERAGINVGELITLANKHPRVKILQPGAGVGGHCIAIDPWFIVADFKKEAQLIRTAREVNNYKSVWVKDQIEKMAKDLRGKLGREPVVACLGLAFKPDIDDLRESPSLKITRDLSVAGYNVLAVEPNVESVKGLTLSLLNEAVEKSDIIVFLVGHKEFKQMTIPDNKLILDYCGVHQKFS